MKPIYVPVIVIFILISVLCTVHEVRAETESDFFMRQRERKEYDWNKWRERYDKRGLARVAENATYGARCSSCHFLYQPWLLPARSWSAIMASPGKHFGKDMALKEKDAKEISKYLIANSADRIKPRNEWTLKILRSIRGITPQSIRAIPYIQRKHRRITPDILARPSVLSLSNCVACHKGASESGYKKKNISIPQ